MLGEVTVLVMLRGRPLVLLFGIIEGGNSEVPSSVLSISLNIGSLTCWCVVLLELIKTLFWCFCIKEINYVNEQRNFFFFSKLLILAWRLLVLHSNCDSMVLEIIADSLGSYIWQYMCREGGR